MIKKIVFWLIKYKKSYENKYKQSDFGKTKRI